VPFKHVSLPNVFIFPVGYSYIAMVFNINTWQVVIEWAKYCTD